MSMSLSQQKGFLNPINRHRNDKTGSVVLSVARNLMSTLFIINETRFYSAKV